MAKQLSPLLQKTWVRITVLFLCVTVLFFIVTYLGWEAKPRRIQLLMQWSILAGVAYTLLRTKKEEDPYQRIFSLILLIAFVMRIGYALYTPATVREHDLGALSSDASGHAGYILYLFKTRSIPVGNDYQLAQPPLFYAVSAVVMKFYQLVTGVNDPIVLFGSVRAVSCISSCAALLIAQQIGKELGLSRKAMLAFLCVCAFLPNHYLLAGRANPDSLSVLFLFAIVLYAIRWYRAQSIRNTAMLALCFGLGMMTKATVVTLALPVGLLMIFKVAKPDDPPRRWTLLGRLLLLILIVVPLGLWHPIRNAIQFSQPFGGVYEFTVNPSDSATYIGDLSFWQRFGILSPNWLFSPQYIADSHTGNMLIHITKTAIFGEFSYTLDKTVPLLLQLSNFGLMILSFPIMFLKVWRALKKREILWLFIGVVWIAAFGSYLWFIVRYPFWCSLDYRYIVATSLTGALFLAAALPGESDCRLPGRLYTFVLFTLLSVFSISSIVMYLNI